MFIMESMGSRSRRARRVFTPQFMVEIVEVCQGGHSIAQVARDFELTETAVLEWIKQAERDAGTRPDGLTSAERAELAALRRESRQRGVARGRGDPQVGHGLLREPDPVNVDPFIETEQAQHGAVARPCQLMQVSGAAYYTRRHGPSQRARTDAA
jgi:transposase